MNSGINAGTDKLVAAELIGVRMAGMASVAKIDPKFAQELKAKPKTTFQVIVRVQGDLNARQEDLEAAGLHITRRLRLIKGFGATATGAALQHLSAQDWIVAIEPDSTLHTM